MLRHKPLHLDAHTPCVAQVEDLLYTLCTLGINEHDKEMHGNAGFSTLTPKTCTLQHTKCVLQNMSQCFEKIKQSFFFCIKIIIQTTAKESGLQERLAIIASVLHHLW